MPFSAEPRQVAAVVETLFAEVQVDWAANGTPVYVVGADVTALEEARLPSENIVPRRTFKHDFIDGLQSSSTFPFGIYMTATGVNAASGAQAVATIETDFMRSAIGGRSLGWASAITGGTVTNPTIDADPGYVAGDWIYFWNDSTSIGSMHRIDLVAGTTLTVIPDLPEAPDVADTFKAVITIYPDNEGLDCYDLVKHTTLGFLVQGDALGDVYEMRGCKPSMEIGGITAGEPTQVAFACMVTQHALTPDAVVVPGAPSGIAPTTPATGTSASVKLADFGAPLVEVECRGTITPNFAIAWQAVMGPNGTEGVHGYIATGVGEGGPTFTVGYDAVYDDDFATAPTTKKHMLVQIGDGLINAWGIYWPRLEYAAKPVRADEGGVTSSTLDMHALEDTADTTGLTGDDLQQRRANFVILIVA